MIFKSYNYWLFLFIGLILIVNEIDSTSSELFKKLDQTTAIDLTDKDEGIQIIEDKLLQIKSNTLKSNEINNDMSQDIIPEAIDDVQLTTTVKPKKRMRKGRRKKKLNHMKLKTKIISTEKRNNKSSEVHVDANSLQLHDIARETTNDDGNKILVEVGSSSKENQNEITNGVKTKHRNKKIRNQKRKLLRESRIRMREKRRRLKKQREKNLEKQLPQENIAGEWSTESSPTLPSSQTSIANSSIDVYDTVRKTFGDFSCVKDGFITAPEVLNADIKYLRNDDNGIMDAYLEAQYNCRPGYEKKLIGGKQSRGEKNLICRQKEWVGEIPSCVKIKEHRRRPKECGKHDCDQICRMKNERPVCLCFKGFKLHGNKCIDINECRQNKSICEFGCSNTIGSYRCKCPNGLKRDVSNNCIDINECNLRNGHGPCQDKCTNTWSSYQCSCDQLPGTHLSDDKHSCEDVDECLDNNGGCSHTCLNTMGRSFCVCPEGWVLDDDWKTCVDIDECIDQNNLTPEIRCEFGCINTIGSYRCIMEEVRADQPISDETPDTCNSGLIYNKTTEDCEDIDECDVANGGCSDRCLNTHGSYDCICSMGYYFGPDKRTCIRSNDFTNVACPPLFPPRHGYLECSRPAGQRITNRPGSQCVLRCPIGYRMIGSFAKTCGNNGRWLGNGEGVCIRYPVPKIICPADIKYEIPPNETIVVLEIPLPKTDVNVDRNLNLEPESLRDKTEFEIGVYNVTYTARHPVSKLSVSCTFTISVIEGKAPSVFFCPENQKHTVNKISEMLKITWVEPIFIDNINVTEVIKSNSPGNYFGVGSHLITYEARDRIGYKTKCQFKILVNARRRHSLIKLPKF